MSDEKTTIYISPEEDLTSVRERIEKLPAHNITLVIPTETQLRSSVAWRLLRVRVRDLGKEVQIVSDSAQVRSVAKDANFRVASSLEASPTGKSRPPSHTGRILGGRSKPANSMQRPTTKKSTNLRSPERTYQTERANQSLSSAEYPDSDQAILDDDLSDHAPQPSTPSFDNAFPMTPERGQHYDIQHIDTSPPIRPLPPHYLEEEPDLWTEDFREAQHIRESASHGNFTPSDAPVQEDAFEREEEISPSKAAFPADPLITPLPYLGDDPINSMDDALSPPSPSMGQEQRGSVAAFDSFETQEHIIHDVPDIPHEALHGSIEDEGDQGDFVVHSDHQWREPIAEDDQDRVGPSRAYNVRPRSSRSGRQSPRPQIPPLVPEQNFDSDDDLLSLPDPPTQVTPQAPPVRPAASGTLRSSRGLQSPQQGTGKSGGLVQGQGTAKSGGLVQGQGTAKSGGLPPSPSRVSGAVTPQNIRASGGLQNQSTRVSSNLPPNAPRSGSGTLAPDQPRKSSNQLRQSSNQLRPGATPGSRAGSGGQLSSTSGRSRTVLSKPGTRLGRTNAPSRQMPPPVKRASRRRSPMSLFIALAAIIVVGILLLLCWLLPTATVTIALPAQDYSAPVKLVAAPGSQTHLAIGTVQETTLTKDFTLSGTGKATGTKKVGTATARGRVFFTNNSNQQIIIPSNILLSTSNGTQFVTEDNIALGPKNSPLSRLPSFIDAQVSGDSGNVPAGSITIIPASTKNQIEQNNSKISPSAIDLQVTNDEPTSGGGVGSAIAVTQQDLANTQSALSSQLQSGVNAWLQQQLSPGDVAGKPIITPTLTDAPKVDTIEKSGTFAASLKQTVEVAVVRNSALQAATIAQLNATLSQDKKLQNYQIVSSAQQLVQIPKITPVSNGLSLTLNFKAVSKVIQKFEQDALQRQIVNKSPGDAEETLKSFLHTAQSIQVEIHPAWLPFTPWQAGNIHIQLVAASIVPTKK